MSLHRYAALGLLALVFAGCGSGDIVPVSGRVTLNGQPLAGATVSFQPLSPSKTEQPAAGGSAGKTDAAGHYQLRMIEPDQEGALIGEHVVTITKATAANGDGAAVKGEQVPKKWRDGSQRFEVPHGGTGAADFDLRS